MLQPSRFVSLLITIIFLYSPFSMASENDQWQQFKAHKGMQELDAQFEQPKPEVQIKTKVVEKVVEKVVVEKVYITTPAPSPAEQPAPETATPVANNELTEEVDGYVFKLSACSLSRKTIKCDLSIQSTEDDASLTLYTNYNSSAGYVARLHDRNGYEYHASKVKMANKSSTKSIKNRYIAGITAKGSLHFSNVKSDTNGIALMYIGFLDHKVNRIKSVKFRNVTLSM